MDPELLPGSGSGIKVPDPDPAKSDEHINRTVNSGLFVLRYWTVVLNRGWQIVVKILVFD